LGVLWGLGEVRVAGKDSCEKYFVVDGRACGIATHVSAIM